MLQNEIGLVSLPYFVLSKTNVVSSSAVSRVVTPWVHYRHPFPSLHSNSILNSNPSAELRLL